MKLALGTVQFGLNYGVTNKSGQVSVGEIERILGIARDAAIDTLDTAIAYGESEPRLGQAGVQSWKVISKLPGIPADCPVVGDWVSFSLEGSLKSLRLERLYGLLLHRPQDLIGPRGPDLYAALQRLLESGKVQKIGVSTYSPDELSAILPRFAVQLIQAPFNVFDRRLETSGQLERLKAQGIEVHTRSTFLQGLLLLTPEECPAQFKAWGPLWSRWHGWLMENSLSPLQGALRFACRNPAIDRVLVGVDSAHQLQAIIAAYEGPMPPVPVEISTGDEALLNPSRWGTL